MTGSRVCRPRGELARSVRNTVPTRSMGTRFDATKCEINSQRGGFNPVPARSVERRFGAENATSIRSVALETPFPRGA
jgi:hypothetical protein